MPGGPRTAIVAPQFDPILCKIWVHDETFSTEHVLFNPSLLAKPELDPGAVIQVRHKSSPGARELAHHHFSHGHPGIEVSIAPNSFSSFIFVSRQAEQEVTSRNPNLQLSVSQKIAELFHFAKNTDVWVSLADPKLHTATHVEVSIRNVYLTRADMQRMAISSLMGNAVYTGQPISYASTVRATVKAIYRNGREVKSAMIRTSTKPIFRSESARFILYIQMSREMWDFDTDASEEVCFDKVVNGVLPELFAKWSRLNARHIVNIVLFTRIEYQTPTGTTNLGQSIGDSCLDVSTRDFYRVVVGEVSSGEWAEILHQLKREFKSFLREILMYQAPYTASSDPHQDHALTSIVGRPSTSRSGNILEAINTAAAPFSKDWVDTDLFRTGLSIVVITPGSGVFEVDEAMLRLTTDNLVKNGINIDLVCLSRPPLHVVPLFRYVSSPVPGFDPVPSMSSSPATTRRPIFASTPPYSRSMLETASKISRLEEEPTWVCVVPQWAHIHFWQPTDHRLLTKSMSRDLSLLRDIDAEVHCSIYDVQMTGIMESEMSSIALPHLEPRVSLSYESGSTPRPFESFPGPIHHLSYSPSSRQSPEDSARPGDVPADRAIRRKAASDLVTLMDKYDSHRFVVKTTAITVRPVFSRQNSNGVHLRERRESTLSQVVRDTFAETALGNSPESPTPPISHRFRLEQHHRRRDTLGGASGGSATPADRPTLPPSAGGFRTPSSGGARFDSRLLLGTSKGLTLGKAAASTVHSQEQGLRYSNPLDPLFSYSPSTPGNLHSISDQVRSSLSRPSTAITSPTPSSRAPSVMTAPRDVPKPDQESAAWQSIEPPLVKPQNLNISRSPPRQSQHSILEARRKTNEEWRGDYAGPLPIDLAPWLTIVNPARPDEAITTDHGWSHAFTQPSQGLALKMKWKSLCSPAALPLTSDYTVSPDLLDQYEERPHKVALDEDEDGPSLSLSRARLLGEMVAFRLSKGFQVIKNVHDSSLGVQSITAFDDAPLTNDGCTITLVKGNQVHILCATGPEIQVTRYQPKSSSGEAYANLPAYEPIIRSTLEPTYEQVSTRLYIPKDPLNWSMIDNCLAGHFENFSEATGYWRAKFVLIPVEPPKHARRALKAGLEDSNDELRIEGIQKLTQMWETARASTGESPSLAAINSRINLSPNPLGLEFQTRDASAVLSAGLEDSRLLQGQSFVPSTRLFADSELHRSDKIDLKKLAVDLQGDRGIDIKDRWWYLRFHPNAFLGVDLTSWLLQNFKDINSRKEAEQLGGKLMDLGLFKHVKTHGFRDGNYFYTLMAEYRNLPARPPTRSFFSRRPEKVSAPGTPQSDKSRDVSRSSTLDKSPYVKARDSLSNSPQPLRPVRDRRRVYLTGDIQLDLDINHRSSRPELVNLHYDRLFNPEACYHFRMEWLHTTAKLVEEAVSAWAGTAERYGLKFVQAPVSEACKIALQNPFRTPSVIELVVPPPEAEPDLSHVDSTAPEPLPTHRYHPYQRALLKKFDYVLDEEAGVNFPEDVEVRYSFNHSPYTYSQYIHKSGLVLAQVDVEGRLLLVANRLLTNQRRDINTQRREDKDKSGLFEKRSSAARPLSSSMPLAGGPSGHAGGLASTLGSPTGGARPLQVPMASSAHSSMQSPLFPPQDATMGLSLAGPTLTAEWLKSQITAFCSNELELCRFYDEVSQRDPVLSPRSTPAMVARETPSTKGTPLLTATIPTLELPPIGGIEEALERLTR